MFSHPFPGRLAVAIVALTCALTGALPANMSAQTLGKFDGEYGLYARVVDGGLEVRWITSTASTGVLYAHVDHVEVQRIETVAGQIHEALVETTAPEVELTYGALGGDMHHTLIVRTPEPRPTLEITDVDDLYVFGDVHGEFDRVVAVMRNAGLIDEALAWTGGVAHVAFLGDIFDRGDDVTRVLWFLYRLEREAAAAGGAVHLVLGNHEVMVMSGDLRYVGNKESLLASAYGVSYQTLFDVHESVLGRWLASKPGLIRVDDLLLAHGGMSPAYIDYDLAEYQDSLSAFIDEELFSRWADQEYLDTYGDDIEPGETAIDSLGIVRRYEFFFGDESVMWYRELVRSGAHGEFVDTVLEEYESAIHVVGHTPVPVIGELYDGRLIATDLEEAASEMLHLRRRKDGGWDRWRVPLTGEPIQLVELERAN